MSASRAASRRAGAGALGQLLFIGLEENRWSAALERRLRAWQPAGVFLTTRNIRSPGSTAELLARIARALETPPFLALEEEGGMADPLRKFFPPLPSPRIAARRGPSAVARLGELIGAAIRLLGFNTNLAPVLDLSHASADAHTGARSFSTDADQVERCASAFVRGLERHRVLACGKHFPGLSVATLDRHSGLLVVGKPMAAMWRADLVPYRRLLSRLPLVMVSHAAYKAYDFDLLRPATVSVNVLEGLLRVKLGYAGVAVSADLVSEPLRRTLEPERAAVEAVNAGCDLLLVGREEAAEGILTSLGKSLEAGSLSAQRVVQALGRLRLAKRGLAPPSGKLSKLALEKLAGRLEDFAKQCGTREQKIA